MPNIDEETLVDQGAIPPTDFRENIERIREVARYDIEADPDLLARLNEAARGILVAPDILTAAAASLRVGHLVLQGPPGTGKSSLARALCDAFNVSALPVTAHEDWTIFDLIGRLELHLDSDRKEQILPVNGYFTDAVIHCANSIVRHFDDPREPQGEWLLIDELNRAHADRAFGELFTVLGTDAQIPVTLPHQREGNRNLVVPRRFRIIATLNSFDRQFVNNLSQALRRRFTFITVDIPEKRPDGIAWSNTDDTAPMAIQEFRVVLLKAAQRTAARVTSLDPERFGEAQAELHARLMGPLAPYIALLFDLIERVRYARLGEPTPHLPIGTAQMIDTVELFLLRLLQDGIQDANAGGILDWAASVKIAPLFDSDVIASDILQNFAGSLPPPFDKSTSRALRGILAAGTHFVE